MPSSLVPTLKWDGIVLTIIAIIYTQFMELLRLPRPVRRLRRRR